MTASDPGRELESARESGVGWAALAGPAMERRTIGELVRVAAAQFGSSPFVTFQGQVISYEEMNARTNRVANALRTLGIRTGSRVAVLCSNRLEYLDLWFGLSKLGAIELPVNSSYKHPQIHHVLGRADVAAIVVEGALTAGLDQVIAEFPRCQVIELDGAPQPPRLSYRELLRSASATEPKGIAVSGGDVVAVMNTSGTTGLSKGVRLSHAQQYSLGQNMAAALRLSRDDVYYNYFPLFHNTAQAMITLPVMLAGARMVLKEKFSVSAFWSDVHAHGVTAFYFIGEMLQLLVRQSPVGAHVGSRLRAGWGIGASADVTEAFETRFGVRLGTCYGSTEGNVPVVRELGAAAPRASVGRVIPGFEIRIVDAQGKEVSDAGVGEILQRAQLPQMMMNGYDADAAATAAAMRDGWYHTGDAGRMDAQGNVYFVSRIKDVIRIRGENISGFEIEQELLQCPGVIEAAAIAVPGELGGDEVKIVLVADADAALSWQSLLLFCEQRLPRYALPRYVEFRRELPKTETNKVRKHILREEAFSSSTWDLKKGMWAV